VEAALAEPRCFPLKQKNRPKSRHNLHQFETQELTYQLVCCGAHRGRRALSSTGTRAHTGLMAEARSNCVFLTGP
jgi:hypothetical protein